MNIVLKKRGEPGEFYVSCVKKNGKFFVLGKYVTLEGKIRETSTTGPFKTESDAVKRCRALAKTKIRKKGFKEVELSNIPEKVAPFLEVDPSMQVSPAELLQHIQEARLERYVVFKDVLGIEDSFDAGVEYLAHTTDDKGCLTVFDRFGEPKKCFVERMESVKATEEAKKAEGLKSL